MPAAVLCVGALQQAAVVPAGCCCCVGSSAEALHTLPAAGARGATYTCRLTRPRRARCPKLLRLPLNKELRTNVALLVGSGLVGADLGRVVAVAPGALGRSPRALQHNLDLVRQTLGGSMQARARCAPRARAAAPRHGNPGRRSSAKAFRTGCVSFRCVTPRFACLQHDCQVGAACLHRADR